MKHSHFFAALIVFCAITFTSCDKDRGVNLFSLSQDIEFGRVMDSTIKADPVEYPILDPVQYADAYTYVNTMMQQILESEKIKYKTEFEWEITLINKDVMNAFAVPGGRLYFYTGLIKYLDDAASFAGVLGHEMAHVDLRHSTKTLTDLYGFSFLVSLLIGNNSSQLAQIAGDMATGAAGLKFSRNHEYDADKYSMYYLSETKYHPKGIASFFIKLQDEGHTGSTFEFLSTHPSDQKRIDNIGQVWENDSYLKEKSSGKAYDYFEQEYINELISKLP
ncbi:MAG: M48 family metalloprotease [Bacteroidales bacterium]|nr:M48 family metalloprotease [Bacteroidales bacterium]